jgi:hypothetical protein
MFRRSALRRLSLPFGRDDTLPAGLLRPTPLRYSVDDADPSENFTLLKPRDVSPAASWLNLRRNAAWHEACINVIHLTK